jgi:hypothetical protein
MTHPGFSPGCVFVQPRLENRISSANARVFLKGNRLIEKVAGTLTFFINLQRRQRMSPGRSGVELALP